MRGTFKGVIPLEQKFWVLKIFCNRNQEIENLSEFFLIETEIDSRKIEISKVIEVFFS